MMGRDYSRGFTLIELMVAVAIVGILGGIAIPSYLGYLDKARIARSIAEIRQIEKSIKLAYATAESYPLTLADIGADKILDPWGMPYQYLTLTAGGPVTRGTITQGEGTNLWSWFTPSSAYATSSNHGQGNNNGGGNHGNGGNQGNGNQTGAGKNPGNAGGNPNPSGGGTNGLPSGGGGARKDRFGVPLNSDFDLYSMGKNRESADSLSTAKSYDDIVRASDGMFVGLASDF